MTQHDHSLLLNYVKRDMPNDDILSELSSLFKIFGDGTRMKILFALFESELCVCAIAELLSMTQSAISHQLKILKDNKLVGSRRDGKTIYYFLLDEHVRLIIGMGYQHIMEDKNDEKDL